MSQTLFEEMDLSHTEWPIGEAGYITRLSSELKVLLPQLLKMLPADIPHLAVPFEDCLSWDLPHPRPFFLLKAEYTQCLIDMGQTWPFWSNFWDSSEGYPILRFPVKSVDTFLRLFPFAPSYFLSLPPTGVFPKSTP